MQNAHLRLGLLEYHRMTEKTSTRIRLRVDRYVGEDEQAHLISVFGNDSDVGAITAAVHEKATFTLTFPDAEVKEVSLGEHASCYKGAVSLPDRKHSVRHLVAVSEELYTNGGVGRLRGGRHLRFPTDTLIANLHRTLLEELGIRVDHFGNSTGRLDI